ncbi:hypothetical protein B0T14DRAFT_106120 [Immersiella caudata]|uniref:Uncharacterized protein n=1 Tax=Immersiella caudata TaxID=314043 RepID=A0AA39X388_9PEZI|nr:hypothetical protein B0T14DRAFT_106120 [Immersiella caudata]
MDDNRGQRRQNEPPTHSGSSARYHPSLHDQSQQRRSFTSSHGDRFRPAPLSTSSTGAARGMGGSTSYSTYYQEPTAAAFSTTGMGQSTISYHHTPTDYGQTDTRQTPGFASAYNPAMIYNVPQATGPQNTAVYDTSQQFPARQPAGLGMMATDVAAPYFSGEPTNSAAASALQAAQTGSSAASQVYQQPTLQNYSTSSMTAMGGMASQSSSAQDVRMDEEYPAPEGLDAAYASYQSALKAIFQNIQDGALASASDSLLNVSDWLLSHVAELGIMPGLTSDDQNLHSDRIKLWNDFNHAWLAMLQAQKDMMESGQQISRSQSLIPEEGLRRMGGELVRLCDSIERHGLVDYEYGVWEEQIVAILTECVDLYDSSASSSASHHR